MKKTATLSSCARLNRRSVPGMTGALADSAHVCHSLLTNPKSVAEISGHVESEGIVNVEDQGQLLAGLLVGRCAFQKCHCALLLKV